MTPTTDCLDILVLAPIGRDAELIAKHLGEFGLACRPVTTVEQIADSVPDGIGMAILGEEALDAHGIAALSSVLSSQPSWSDLPIVLLSGTRRARDTAAALAKLGNITVVERPVHVRTLVSAAEAGLRARRRQYAARSEIAQRDQFLAMLGHELRNPLAAIVFAADFLQRGDAQAEPNRHVSIVNRQAQHLSRLVDDLLEVSRVTAGKVVLERKSIDLEEAVRKSLTTLQERAHKRGVQITVHAPDESLWIEADAVRLEQVFGNLLGNAIKYSSPGGAIQVRIAHEGESAVVAVRDEGIGMEVQMLPRVFDLFAQARPSIARTQGGLGIGLTLVKNLVELHGGCVRAHSEGLGRGSEFSVSFPLPSQSVAERRGSRAEARCAAGLNLVVIEDNADLCDLLRAMLERAGHTVQVACDGVEGVSLIESVKPDCALVDIGLPGLSGYEVAEQVRRSEQGHATLVAITGYGQPEDRQRALAAGFDAHMKKPVDMHALQSLLSKVQPRV